MDFFKIQNNTNNSIIVNGTYIGPKSYAVLSDDAVSLIDKQYFDAGILINRGPTSVENNYVMIDTKTVQFYKKPPSGIPRSHLDEDVNTSLKKADRSLQKGTVKMEDLDTTLQNIIKSVGSDINGDNVSDTSTSSRNLPPNPSSNSILIRERQLEKSIRDVLELARIAYQKLEDGISYDELSPELQGAIDRTSNSYSFWKDPVEIREMLPSISNRDGDVRLVLNDGTLWRWSDSSTDWINITPQCEPTSQNPTPEEPYDGVPIPVGQLDTRYVLGEFFAREGQTVFRLQKPYPFGTGNLQVMLNGLLMMKDVDYVEIDEYKIQFSHPLTLDDHVVMYLSVIGGDPFIVVENHLIEQDKIRLLHLDHAFAPNTGAIRVYLNGMFVNNGPDEDYIEVDSNNIRFNYDLMKGDKVIVRIESSEIIDNVKNQFAAINKVYMNLAKQLHLLTEEVRDLKQ